MNPLLPSSTTVYKTHNTLYLTLLFVQQLLTARVWAGLDQVPTVSALQLGAAGPLSNGS